MPRKSNGPLPALARLAVVLWGLAAKQWATPGKIIASVEGRVRP